MTSGSNDFKKLMLAACATVLVIIAAAGVTTYQHLSSMVTQRRLVMHTQELLTGIANLKEAVRDAESAQRGYLLTGKKMYLGPYHVARKRSVEWSQKIGVLLHDPRQKSLHSELSDHLQKKLEEMDETIETSDRLGKEAAVNIVLTDRGQAEMEKLDKLFDEMQDEEEQLLRDNIEKLSGSTDESFIRLGVMTAIVFGIFAFASFFMNSMAAARQREREEFEAELRKQNRRFEELASSVDEVFFITSEGATQHFYISPAYERVWQRPMKEVMDQPDSWLRYVATEDRRAVGEFLDSFAKLGPSQSSEVEYRVIRPDGTIRWVCARAFPSIEPDSNSKRICGTVTDITERKESDRHVSEFYSTISHELRTPLTSIRGALGLLEGGKAGELSKRAQHLVSMGRTECERLIRLINDILDVRKLQAGMLDLKLGPIDPEQIVNDTITNLSSYASERNVTLDAKVDCNKIINADRDRLTQILTNLVSNAVKFSPENGTVTISTCSTGNQITFKVTDSGGGISKENQNKLFKLFQQVDSSDTRPKEGTGLGLAISKALVEQHRGTIGVDSEEGKGSTFWFTIPYMLPEEDILLTGNTTTALPRVGEKPEAVKSGNGGSGGATRKLGESGDRFVHPMVEVHQGREKRILVVEDDDNIADIIMTALTDDGFSVDRVSKLSDAKQALEADKEARLSAIILDLGLPDGDGLSLFDSLQDKHSALPVVIVTARENQNDMTYPLVVDWITKPFDEARLLRSVQLAVSGREPGEARILIVEDDDATREILKQQVSSLDVQLFEAADGRSAVEIARSQPLDLIILDLGLPDIDGFTVVAILKGEHKLDDVPLIVYTARDLNESDKERLRLGLTSYMTKAKASEAVFLEHVRTLLNGLLRS